MTYGSLFSGIGGLDLGLDRAGMKCVWQVESDPYAQKVLSKHWPNVRRWDDVRTFPPEGDWRCDLIAGGFPCQDISCAGSRTGIDGSRSGLWAEFARVVRLVRPRYVLVENVAALLHRGISRVLGDLAACGYDAQWDCIPASAVGAPHRRDRLFIVAYAGANGRDTQSQDEEGAKGSSRGPTVPSGEQRPDHGRRLAPITCAGAGVSVAPIFGSVDGRRKQCEEGGEKERLLRQWIAEPDVGRVADGVPARVDRLRCLGNAVVPQVAEWIARRLLEATHDD